MIGYAMCGSFCNFKTCLGILKELTEKGYDVLPIMSENAYSTDTKFGKAEDFNSKIKEYCQKEIIHEIKTAEPIGPSVKLDCLCICPCTGNTIAKLAHGICDTPVTMAVKAQLRNERPVVIALASNDALSLNAASIGTMLGRKNVYFVPFCQDDPDKKPRSAVCRFELLESTMKYAIQGKQIQPILYDK